MFKFYFWFLPSFNISWCFVSILTAESSIYMVFSHFGSFFFVLIFFFLGRSRWSWNAVYCFMSCEYFDFCLRKISNLCTIKELVVKKVSKSEGWISCYGKIVLLCQIWHVECESIESRSERSSWSLATILTYLITYLLR